MNIACYKPTAIKIVRPDIINPNQVEKGFCQRMIQSLWILADYMTQAYYDLMDRGIYLYDGESAMFGIKATPGFDPIRFFTGIEKSIPHHQIPTNGQKPRRFIILCLTSIYQCSETSSLNPSRHHGLVFGTQSSYRQDPTMVISPWRGFESVRSSYKNMAMNTSVWTIHTMPLLISETISLFRRRAISLKRNIAWAGSYVDERSRRSHFIFHCPSQRSAAKSFRISRLSNGSSASQRLLEVPDKARSGFEVDEARGVTLFYNTKAL